MVKTFGIKLIALVEIFLGFLGTLFTLMIWGDLKKYGGEGWLLFPLIAGVSLYLILGIGIYRRSKIAWVAHRIFTIGFLIIPAWMLGLFGFDGDLILSSILLFLIGGCLSAEFFLNLPHVKEQFGIGPKPKL